MRTNTHNILMHVYTYTYSRTRSVIQTLLQVSDKQQIKWEENLHTVYDLKQKWN
jgi:hypothetical protein